MKAHNITFILPGINPHLWQGLYTNLKEVCKDNSFLIRAIGPTEPDQELLAQENFIFTKSFARPTACVQQESLKAESKLLSIICDDSRFISSIDKQISEFNNLDIQKDILCLRYTEGNNHAGNPRDFGDFYWTVWFHPWHHAPGIPMEYKIAPIGIMGTDTFKDIGGIDCRFEVMSLAPHDMVYRLQKNGGKVELSKEIVITLDRPIDNGTKTVVEEAFFGHDHAFYVNLYKDKDHTRIKIDPNNYTAFLDTWTRRFKQ